MAAPKSWLHKVPEILELLAAIETPVIDRAAFERIFAVRRRRAIQLMQGFGAMQAGQSLVLDRLALINLLECVQAGAEFAQETRRRQKVTEALESARRLRRAAAVKLLVPPVVDGARLPPSVSLQPGLLQVEFSGAKDLLGKLYTVARAAAADFDAFQEITGG